MGVIQSYRDLIVWQKAIDFAEVVYKTTQHWPKHETYGLTSQLRRSAVSVSSNIAEGQARQHTREFKQFLHITLGSVAEAHTQIIIAKRLGYLNVDQFQQLENRTIEIQKMLRALVNKLRT